MARDHLVGIDIGGTKCAVLLGCAGTGSRPEVIARTEFPTQIPGGPEAVVWRLQQETALMLEENGLSAKNLRSIGISCGNPLDSRRGLILSPPNLPGWDEIPIVKAFHDHFQVPAHLQNDANAGALAEWLFGAGRGARNMIFCTFGTGFGAGLILDGRLYSGTNDMAGEIGHVRLSTEGPVGYGKRGSVEGFCSGGGLVQLARQLVFEQLQMGTKVKFCPSVADMDKLTPKSVAEAARAGDELAIEIYAQLGRRVGQTLAILVDLFNPEVIVLGSIFVRQHELIWPEALRVLQEEALPHSVKVCKVVPSELAEQIGDYASLAVAAVE